MKITNLLVATSLGIALAGSMQAGSIFLTGHDIDFHDNAQGYSTVILNYLRNGAATYRVGALRTAATGTFNNPPNPGGTVYDSLDVRDPASFADAAAFAAWLGTIDALEIASHTSCGGCALTTAGSDIINGFKPQITAFFNAGGDIWGNTGGSLATFYNFLPPTALASGAAISGSTGFVPTAAGLGIGITDIMVNGDPTHNRFTSFAAAFTVFETRANASLAGGQEIISIGFRDGTIDDDGGITVSPEPSTWSLLAAAVGILAYRRRK